MNYREKILRIKNILFNNYSPNDLLFIFYNSTYCNEKNSNIRLQHPNKNILYYFILTDQEFGNEMEFKNGHNLITDKDVWNNGRIVRNINNIILIIEELTKNNYLKKISNKEYDSYFLTLKLFLEIENNKNIFYARQFENEHSMNFYDKFKKNLLNKYIWLKLIMLEDKKAIGNINNYIKNSIDNCSIFIADLSTNDKNQLNYNVMYEIGMAHALNKKTILLMEKEQFNIFVKKEGKDLPKLPFDISSHNIISYDLNDLENTINEVIEMIGDMINKN